MLHTQVENGEVPVIFLKGEVDLDSAETFRWVVADVGKGVAEVIIDFAGVSFIDSSGTGIFVRLSLDLKSQGTPLVARNLSPAVKGVFDMLRVRELVGDDVFPD